MLCQNVSMFFFFFYELQTKLVVIVNIVTRTTYTCKAVFYVTNEVWS